MPVRIFTVPDYYPGFVCKAENCRRNCCFGWHITVSMRDYFRLVGLECSPDLRSRLDRALHVLRDATPERYAEFSRTYTGECPLIRPDGLCALQRECGEDALSSVCRYYPRSPRTLHGSECSLSVTCEGVCETLFLKKDKMRFIKRELEFKYDLPSPCDDTVTRFYERTRGLFISLLQDRDHTISERLCACEKAARLLDTAFETGDEETIAASLDECKKITPVNAQNAPDERGFTSARAMLSRLAERYPIENYVKNTAQTEYSSYAGMIKDFERKFPGHAVMAEQVLVNHVFYETFPFAEYPRAKVYQAFASLAALYAVWKAAAVCSCARSGGIDELVELTCDIFRMSENSNFNTLSLALVAERGKCKSEDIIALCNA